MVLGIFGFLAHPELSAESADGTSGNYGTYDQVAALKWVHKNIAQFGGDPNNITVLGQSAGAASIKNLVSSPLSKGLIKNAIIQSGGGIGAFGNSENGQKQAEATGKAFMEKFGYKNLKAMRAVPAERLLEIFKAEGMNLIRPHIDGILLTESFDDASRCEVVVLTDILVDKLRILMLRAGYTYEEGIWAKGGIDDSDDCMNVNRGLSAGLSVQAPLSKEENGMKLAVDYAFRDTYTFKGHHSVGVRIIF